MPPPGLQIKLRRRVPLTFDLTSKVDRFVLLVVVVVHLYSAFM